MNITDQILLFLVSRASDNYYKVELETYIMDDCHFVGFDVSCTWFTWIFRISTQNRHFMVDFPPKKTSVAEVQDFYHLNLKDIIYGSVFQEYMI